MQQFDRYIFIGNLRKSGLSKEVDAVLKKKIIWPFPSVSDGKDSGHVERMAICKEAKYQLWMGKTKEEKEATWNLVNGTFKYSQKYYDKKITRYGSDHRQLRREHFGTILHRKQHCRGGRSLKTLQKETIIILRTFAIVYQFFQYKFFQSRSRSHYCR